MLSMKNINIGTFVARVYYICMTKELRVKVRCFLYLYKKIISYLFLYACASGFAMNSAESSATAERNHLKWTLRLDDITLFTIILV